MPTKALFFPPLDTLVRLASLSGVDFLIDTSNMPSMGTIYIQSKGAAPMSLAWAFADVEYRFEVYFIEAEILGELQIESPEIVASFPSLQSMEFLFRAEWLRPALPGEVPAQFEQVVEECGSFSRIPATATAVGLAFVGVLFESAKDNGVVGVCVDDARNYSLKLITKEHLAGGTVIDLDRVPLAGLQQWMFERSL